MQSLERWITSRHYGQTAEAIILEPAGSALFSYNLFLNSKKHFL